MATKVGFQLESSLASKHLTDAEFIKGGYFVVDTYENLTATGDAAKYIPATATQDGTIIKGSLCYVTGTEENPVNKFYQYNGTEWVEANLGGSGGGTAQDGLIYIEPIDDGTQTVVIENKQSKVKFYHSEEYDEAKLTVDDKKVLTEEDIFGDDVLFILESEGADVQLVTLDKTKLV
jgi:hypothetical protein